MNRARLTGRAGSRNAGAYRAEPSWLVARMSRRPLRRNAAVPVIESSRRWTLGRTRWGVARRRAGAAALAGATRGMGGGRPAVTELRGGGAGLEALCGDPPGPAAFQPDVVLDRDAGQQRHFLPAQPGHPPVPAVGRKPGLPGGELGPSGGQELADLGADVVAAGHVASLPMPAAGKGVPASTPLGRDSLAPV